MPPVCCRIERCVVLAALGISFKIARHIQSNDNSPITMALDKEGGMKFEGKEME